MNIGIEHDAVALARLTGSPRAACDGIVLAHGRPAEVIACTLRDNPLGDDWLLDSELPGTRVIAWSGTLASDLFDRHPLTWMQTGHKAFNEFCRVVRPQLERHGRTLCFHPHSRHVLSDVQSCVNFLRDHEGAPFEIALAPASLLEPEMLKDVEDHLQRAFETLGERCAVVILGDVIVREDGDEDESRCEPVPLGDGVLPRDLVRDLLQRCVPETTPIVINAAKIEQQLAWLK